ncbi:MAG: erythromycin esterase family protein [Lachnospiraceae bacterium]
MGKSRKKHFIIRSIILGMLIIIIIAGGIYCRFGGVGTGKSADTAEFAKYAGQVSEIIIPEETRIIALGEATHGNAEFQQLKLDVFQIMVEKYGVKSFALEADCGCCETANRYIHGGEGTAEQVADALGFQIYKTDEIANLLSWMREYNEKAGEGEDLCFYGFDMQSYEENYEYFIEMAGALGADTAELKKIWNNGTRNNDYTGEQRAEIIKGVKEMLLENEKPETSQAVHFADILLQNIELENAMEDMQAGMALRDRFMAENTMWILRQEEARENSRIFISGHNGHVDQFGSYDEENPYMGHILADTIGQTSYFVIGTDFYKTTNNMPNGSEKRTKFTAYSHDPLAKAAKKCGYDICWLDFSKIPEESALKPEVIGYCYMGNLGENQMSLLNRIIMRVFPYAYRIWGSPASMYDGMIFVTEAHPIQIR